VRRSIAIFDAVNVTAAALLVTALVARIALSTAELGMLPFGLGLVLGFAAADVASGLIHWFCDTYFAPNTPFIGPLIIAPFREHHLDPAAIARHGVLERNGNNCFAALPVLVMALGSLEPAVARHVWHDLLSGFLAALAITLCLTNQIHAWVHGASAPWLVRQLQRAGVLIAPARHDVHHRGERAYAVVSGWSNAWLDPSLARTERLLAALGVQPSIAAASDVAARRRPPAAPSARLD
jgi:ubiquitin-conjugating enzyme E2 variant